MRMEAKINIAAILKDKPQGTKLYSSACGKCKLESVDDKSFKISFYNSKFGFMNGGEGYLDKNGKLYDDGECVVFPSKEMRDWGKFAWKKGDVLISNDGKKEVFFNGFTDDTYALFKAKHGFEVLPNGNTIYLANEDDIATDDYTLEDKNDAQTYINTIEERLGGKLNRETLKIEPAQPEFKDGDIVYAKRDDFHYPSIHILNINGDTKRYYARLVISGRYDESIDYDILAFDNENPNRLRLATEEEKKQLFDALAKEGKAWDAENKEIVDLKPKIKLKPFDRVLCRDGVGKEWHIDLFESVLTDNSEYNYKCMVNVWKICIPYKGNEYLLGTTKDVEG